MVAPLSQYQHTCKRAKENVKTTFAARDEELQRKQKLDNARKENPKNREKIVSFESLREYVTRKFEGM